jgi:hypothetical protein
LSRIPGFQGREIGIVFAQKNKERELAQKLLFKKHC